MATLACSQERGDETISDRNDCIDRKHNVCMLTRFLCSTDTCLHVSWNSPDAPKCSTWTVSWSRSVASVDYSSSFLGAFSWLGEPAVTSEDMTAAHLLDVSLWEHTGPHPFTWTVYSCTFAYWSNRLFFASVSSQREELKTENMYSLPEYVQNLCCC